MREHGIAAEVLDERALARPSRSCGADSSGGLLVPVDGVIYPPSAALALLDARAGAGAEVRERADGRRDRAERRAVRRATTLHADVVVNAAGAAAAALTPGLPIVPRKGHLVITERHPGFCRHQVVELGYLTSAHVMTSESVAFNVQPRSPDRC